MISTPLDFLWETVAYYSFRVNLPQRKKYRLEEGVCPVCRKASRKGTATCLSARCVSIYTIGYVPPYYLRGDYEQKQSDPLPTFR